MQVGIYQNGRVVLISLHPDDPADAPVLVGHLAVAAPQDAEIWHQDGFACVARTFETEQDAVTWAAGIREGMNEGRLFNRGVEILCIARRH